ncbi:MAG: FGGY family carbohydrate kinase [Candidatus Brocadiia bacterium]|nr:FGGY family carbohydrate kinase [Candidatus Brocadiia bacterium]
MARETVLVLDCGSTNITAFAVDADGRIVASAGERNNPSPQQGCPGDWRVWDLDELWGKVASLASKVCAEAGGEGVRAVTVTTWGADGTPVAADGAPTYPPIAWQCPRTRPLADAVAPERARHLYDVTGYQVISFNAWFKMAWLRENAPEALDEADKWMMMPGLLSQRLCGEVSLDATSASTMMALDYRSGGWSEELLAEVGLDESFFPPLMYPGAVIGNVTAAASREIGVPEGTPVMATGHDTQFATIGSGAGPDEAVLSSGTWEILMLRTPGFEPDDVGFTEGLITELDAVRGLYNPQLLMMGSRVLEWVRENLYADVAGRESAYAAMIGEASAIEPGAGGVMMVPSFKPDAGPTKKHNTQGTIVGLGLTSMRAHVYRAAVEGLSFQLKDALRILTAATGFEPKGIRVVGGGSRNGLWNQIRADVLGMPIALTGHKEATVLGAAIAAWVGAGRFSDLEEGQRTLATETIHVEPGENAGRYAELAGRYGSLPPALEDFYSG